MVASRSTVPPVLHEHSVACYSACFHRQKEAQSNRELLLRGLAGRLVSDPLRLVSNARLGSLLYQVGLLWRVT